MAVFVRRRLGREVFDRLVEPLVSAVYAADMERLSVEATLSRFREMEQQHGSLIRAMRQQMKHRPKARSESGARYSMFVTLRDGLSTLVDSLAARLPAGSVCLESAVQRIEHPGDRWRLYVSGAQYRDFDAVIVATPSYVAARLLKPVDADLAADLDSIEHSGHGDCFAGLQGESNPSPLGRHGRRGARHRAKPHPGRSVSAAGSTHTGRRKGTCSCGSSWAVRGGRNWPKCPTSNCDRWCSNTWRNCWASAASPSTATWRTGREPCRSITWATSSSWRGSRAGRATFAACNWRAMPTTASASPIAFMAVNWQPSGPCWLAASHRSGNAPSGHTLPVASPVLPDHCTAADADTAKMRS